MESAHGPMTYLVNAGIFIDFILLILGISFASVRIQDPNNVTFTPTVVLSMFVATVVLTGLLLWKAAIDNVFILFTFATFTVAAILFTYTSILARMRYYA